MVAIYRAGGKQPAKKSSPVVELDVERWDLEAHGVVHHQGKVGFVAGALPGERVKVRIHDDRSRFFHAQLLKVLTPSSVRQAAVCPAAGRCGGCQLHHVGAVAALKLKQDALDQHLRHQLKLTELPWQAPLQADTLGYRRKARLGVWFDKQRKHYAIGFRGMQSNKIESISECQVLSPVIAPSISVLHQQLPRLKQGTAITHVELLDANGQAYVVVRHVKPLPASDIALLCAAWPEAFWFGESAPDQIEAWQPNSPQPHYVLPDGQVVYFALGDFIQVNQSVNQLMIQQALAWLSLDKSKRVLDLYCGVGNFSLALAPHVAEVIGLEGVAAMVARANHNAAINASKTQSSINAHFYHADLHQSWQGYHWYGVAKGVSTAASHSKPVATGYDIVLLDPARAGAEAAIPQLVELKPTQVLYVSCHPVTFARDAALLLAGGYEIEKIGAMDMFPQTSHLEVMALFRRKR
jgi:23S rRNA (uracil1939-C5)-methyltransferase